MIETYIRQLLEHYNKVVIPGLGAFVKKEGDKNALLFNELFRFNDGMLVQYIAEVENISNAQSLKKIKDFVGSLKKILSSGKQFTFPGIGSLARDVNGKLFFLSVDELMNFQTNDKSVDFNVNENKPLASQSGNHPGNEPFQVNQSDDQETSRNWEVESNREDRDIFDLLSEDSAVQDKKKFRWWWGLGIFVLIFASWLIFWDGINELKNIKESIALIFTSPASQENIKIKDAKHKTDTIERGAGKSILAIVSEEDTDYKSVNNIALKAILNQTHQSFSPKKEKNISQKLNTAGSLKKYHLVAGCFKKKQYANLYVKKLQEKGFTVKMVLRKNGFYTLSIGSYSSLAKAKKALQTISREKNTVCWIMYY